MQTLRLAIFLLPWLFVPTGGDVFLKTKEAAFEVLALAGSLECLLTMSAAATLQEPWVWRWIIATVGISFLQFWWPIITYMQTGPMVVKFHMLMTCLNLLLGALWGSCLAIYVMPIREYQTRVTQWVCQSAAVIALCGLFQWAGFDPVLSYWTNHSWFAASNRGAAMTGGLGQHSYLAAYLALTAPLFLAFRGVKYVVMGGVVWLAIWLTGCWPAQVSLLAGLATYGAIRGWHRYPMYRRWGWLLPLLLIPLAYVTGQRLLADERWPVWVTALEQWKPRFLLGHGLGEFMVRFGWGWEGLKAQTPRLAQATVGWHWAHNEWLQLGYETGIGSLLVAVGLYGQLWRRSLLATPGGALLAAWCAMGMPALLLQSTEFIWHLAPCAMLLVLMLACWTTGGRNARIG